MSEQKGLTSVASGEVEGCPIPVLEVAVGLLTDTRGVARNLFWGYKFFWEGIKLNIHVQ